MNNKVVLTAIVLITLFILLFFNFFLITGNVTFGLKDFEDPEKVIKDLYKAIDIAEQKGNYGCCIEPACTMCYLGHWKFEKGTCYCDDAIREGRDKDVCPECISGIEKGLCISTKESCELNIKEQM